MTEEEFQARASLVQDIAIGLRQRGFWVPRDVDKKDFGAQSQIITAVFNAIDKITPNSKIGEVARKICSPGPFCLFDSPFSFMENIKNAVEYNKEI